MTVFKDFLRNISKEFQQEEHQKWVKARKEYEYERKAEQDRLEQERRTIETQVSSFQREIRDFRYNTLHEFFGSIYGSYASKSSDLMKAAVQFMQRNKNMPLVAASNETLLLIQDLVDTATSIQDYGNTIELLPTNMMMDPYHYGSNRASYCNTVRSMSATMAESFIMDCESRLSSNKLSEILDINIISVLNCVWFFAINRPYSPSSFQRSVFVFNVLYKGYHVDIIISELYVLKQLGGESALQQKLKDILESHRTADELSSIASALMWMNAYRAEESILRYMLSNGLQMTLKMQERLHTLANVRGDAPAHFNVSSTTDTIYFDVSTTAWGDDEYASFFGNLAFQDRRLEYSLAIRDENRELFVTHTLGAPQPEQIFEKMKEVFNAEYDSVVSVDHVTALAISNNGIEKIDCVLAVSSECKQMGLLTHVVRIGKKFNIKFYTLLIPNDALLPDQKQQALSLYKKLSIITTVWENSLKDTTLLAIQQLLNTPSVNSASATASQLF